MGLFDFFKKKTKAVTEEDESLEMLAKLEKGDMFGDGCNADQIPGTIGEFGLDINNPIPVKSILGSHQYLQSLRFPDNTDVLYQRVGSTESQYVKHPIDMYSIMHSNGKVVCTLYISPYHKKNSDMKPKGFK